MPTLNLDILYSIGKKLVEDGDSDAVYKFAFSGKEALKTMKKVFSSVKTVKLYQNYYSIGWEKPCCSFEFNGDKFHVMFLMLRIGNSVTDLCINYYFTNSQRAFYQPFIDKLIEKRQLVSFTLSEDGYCAPSFLDEFLLHFSSTLKYVSIRSECMTSKFRDSLNLVSLTILDAFGDRLPLFCCKTTSLTLAHKYPLPLRSYESFISEHSQISPGLLTVKKLTVDHDIYKNQHGRNGFVDLIEYFPSLELIKFNMAWETPFSFVSFIHPCILNIGKAVKVPSKLVIKFYTENLADVKTFKSVFVDYEYDASILDCSCFRKILRSAGPASTILEIQFPK